MEKRGGEGGQNVDGEKRAEIKNEEKKRRKE